MSRLHVYFTEDERAELERVASANGLSLAAVIRYALRVLLGLPVPSHFPLDDLHREDTRAPR
jgi:hypothetical protein